MPDGQQRSYGFVTATIPSGQSLSQAIDLGPQFWQFAVYMPAAWTAAAITLQACPTIDGTYQDVYDSAGVEHSLVVAASRTVGMIGADEHLWEPLRFIKLRSGTAGAPVNQGAARLLTILRRG